MTIFDVLKFNRELLNRIREIGIRLDDTDYIDLYADYNKMVAAGEKVSYTVAYLSSIYHVSERKVYSLIKRFQSNCNSGAV